MRLRCLELISVILDDCVCEKLFTHALHFGARAGRIAFGDFDLDILALTDTINRAEAERMQRALDRLALRIEHAGLRRDGDTRFAKSGSPYGKPVGAKGVMARTQHRACTGRNRR